MSRPDNGDVVAAIYCRISPTKENKDEKLERQEDDSRSLCGRNSWRVGRVFIDKSRSAWQRNRKRPGWDSMLEGVSEGRFNAIVVYHGDRLIRQPWDLEVLLRLADEKGIRLASPTGTRNLDSADDRYILRIEAAQACKSSDDTSRRVKRAKASLREQGIATLGRTRAFGRDADGAIIKSEADEIRDALARLVAGETVSGLWRDWCQRGVPTVKGGAWRYGTFREMLRRPDLAGLVSHQGVPVGTAKNLKTIVDRTLWDAAQDALGRTAEEYADRPARPRKHLLSGICVCSGCEQAVGAAKTVSGVARYRCIWPHCPKPTSRNMLHLDEYVVAFVLARLDDPRLWRRIEANRAASTAGEFNAAAELEALEARKAEAVTRFAKSRSMTSDLLERMLAGMDEEIAQVRARSASQRSVSVLDGLRGLDRPGWDDLPLDRRRAVVRELATVRLLPAAHGPRFAPETVDLKPVRVRAA